MYTFCTIVWSTDCCVCASIWVHFSNYVKATPNQHRDLSKLFQTFSRYLEICWCQKPPHRSGEQWQENTKTWRSANSCKNLDYRNENSEIFGTLGNRSPGRPGHLDWSVNMSINHPLASVTCQHTTRTFNSLSLALGPCNATCNVTDPRFKVEIRRPSSAQMVSWRSKIPRKWDFSARICRDTNRISVAGC